MENIDYIWMVSIGGVQCWNVYEYVFNMTELNWDCVSIKNGINLSFSLPFLWQMVGNYLIIGKRLHFIALSEFFFCFEFLSS